MKGVNKSDCDFMAMGLLIMGMNILATGYVASLVIYYFISKIFC